MFLFAFFAVFAVLVRRLASLLTARRLMLWGGALLLLSWFIHVYTMAAPGLVDRAGRVKGSDYVQFYVMGSLARDGRIDALYDPQAHLAEGRRRIDSSLGLYAEHPNYGPQVALAFVPFATLPYLRSLVLFLALSALAYALSVWMVWRECGALAKHGVLVAILAAASPLFLTVVRYGQASAFGLLAVSAAFVALRRQRPLFAGFAIGCLAYKPQLGIVFGVVFLATRQWRVVGGALLAIFGQAAIAWFVAGPVTLGRYIGELWLLARHPNLVELFPSEIHSWRGFVQLLVPYDPFVSACAIVGLLVVLVAGTRVWATSAPVGVRWGAIVVLTILASPHLVAYDLLLLTLPLLLFADWAVQHRDHAVSASVRVLLVLLYFAPFSGMIVARLTGVQVSVIAMAILTWQMYQVSIASRAMVAPRWEDVSSQNSATRGWRSSAA